MSRIPPHETLRDDPPIIEVIAAFFVEAYERQINGSAPLHATANPGEVESVALNPKIFNAGGDNVRFILSGHGLNARSFGVEIEGERIALKYAVRRLTLPPGSTRPIGELTGSEIRQNSTYAVFSTGHVLKGSQLLSPDEVQELAQALEGCELAPEFPEWAKSAAG